MGELSKNMLSNCPKMFILGTYWTTWYSFVGEQTCTIDHKMDQSVRQTIISFYLLHSSYMWLQTILSCGKHGKTMHIGDCFKTPILQEILRIQSLHQVEHCAFSEAIRLFKSVWMCKKQTSVSYSSTESEIMSLNAGWRMDGIPRAWFMGSDRRSSSRKHASEWLSTGRPE